MKSLIAAQIINRQRSNGGIHRVCGHAAGSVNYRPGGGYCSGHHHRNTKWHQLAHDTLQDLGAVSIRKTVLPGMAIPMLKIRRPNGRLIFNMEIAIRR